MKKALFLLTLVLVFATAFAKTNSNPTVKANDVQCQKVQKSTNAAYIMTVQYTSNRPEVDATITIVQNDKIIAENISSGESFRVEAEVPFFATLNLYDTSADFVYWSGSPNAGGISMDSSMTTRYMAQDPGPDAVIHTIFR